MTEAGMDEHVARLERLVLALTERWSTLPEVLARCLTCLAALVDAGADARLLAARLHQTQVLPGLQSLAAYVYVDFLHLLHVQYLLYVQYLLHVQYLQYVHCLLYIQYLLHVQYLLYVQYLLHVQYLLYVQHLLYIQYLLYVQYLL